MIQLFLGDSKADLVPNQPIKINSVVFFFSKITIKIQPLKIYFYFKNLIFI